jgi:hypothetical protein
MYSYYLEEPTALLFVPPADVPRHRGVAYHEIRMHRSPKQYNIFLLSVLTEMLVLVTAEGTQ